VICCGISTANGDSGSDDRDGGGMSRSRRVQIRESYSQPLKFHASQTGVQAYKYSLRKYLNDREHLRLEERRSRQAVEVMEHLYPYIQPAQDKDVETI
jgi:hypothetical protein